MLNERPTDYYYVTPGHQVPTRGDHEQCAASPAAGACTARHDTTIIEDDYDSSKHPQPATGAEASDRSGRVVYVSSLSKRSPGAAVAGFMVAGPDLIDEARALRRLVYRPSRRQHSVPDGHFLAQAIGKPIYGATTTELPPSAGNACMPPAALSLPSCRALAGASMLTPSGCRPGADQHPATHLARRPPAC